MPLEPSQLWMRPQKKINESCGDRSKFDELHQRSETDRRANLQFKVSLGLRVSCYERRGTRSHAMLRHRSTYRALDAFVSRKTKIIIPVRHKGHLQHSVRKAGNCELDMPARATKGVTYVLKRVSSTNGRPSHAITSPGDVDASAPLSHASRELAVIRTCPCKH